MTITERLILTPFVLDDAKLFYELSKDPLTMRYLRKCEHTLKSCEELMKKLKVKYGDHPVFNMHKVQIAATGEEVGFITLHKIPDGTDAEIGYNLLSKYWGKGYASGGCQVVIDRAFSETDIDSIFAETDPENDNSLQLLSRMNFKVQSEPGPDQGVMLVLLKDKK
ncbi:MULTISPECIES: GNAT family N-acetyltransferase [unclassified Fusibacter]|uniref:GNAT family N-acetyltransferase n=1 Tax=unclassified Fusibacter TaxID=2624464 RepID=UPI001013BDCF|nr:MULTISPECIES: GNAT family N-acetyltransferase [unclassified Fusibacter]MCK8058192.1 GNAT family N-acetyltransferase [Fusibacter sp. A2]NPE20775.1 GNAT family N-acetyltransferase [Fusibacter sp. A1]RXV62981.1 N-acetyltransferase [Fusibacter sp. A1]